MIRSLNLADVDAFTAGDETIIKEILHPKNGDDDLPYSLAFASIEPGKSSLPHILEKSVEVYIVTSGKGTAFIDGKTIQLEQGSVLKIPAGANQYVKNTGDRSIDFLCIVSPPWSDDQERIL